MISGAHTVELRGFLINVTAFCADTEQSELLDAKLNTVETVHQLHSFVTFVAKKKIK